LPDDCLGILGHLGITHLHRCPPQCFWHLRVVEHVGCLVSRGLRNDRSLVNHAMRYSVKGASTRFCAPDGPIAD
jgi:hypothetical protein